jgi:hypothetical protein
MNASIFENHAVFQTLEQLKTQIQNEEIKVLIDSDNFNTLNSGCDYIIDRLKVALPALVTEADLNALSQELSNALSQINSFLGNKNTGHINNAVNNMTTCVTRARNLPFPFVKSDFNFSKAISNFETTIKDKLELISIKGHETQKLLETLSKEIEEKQKELDSINNLIKQKEKEIIDINNSFQTNYNNIKQSATEQYANDRKAFRNEIDEDKKTFHKEIENQKEEISTKASIILNDLQLKLQEARKLVNIIGNIGLTGNFQINARYHKKAADIWRIIAICFMAILSGILIYTIWDISHGTFDWLKSIIRIVAAGILSYPATYAAQESSKHRKQENYNKRIELELASLNPFIEFLDETKKQLIKEKLVEKYFGNHNNIELKDDKKDVDVPLSVFEKIMKSISSVINK